MVPKINRTIMVFGFSMIFSITYSTQSKAGFAEGFITGLAEGANKGLSESRRREHEKEMLQLQLQQQEKELDLRRQEMELQRKILESGKNSVNLLVDVPDSLDEYYIGRISKIKQNLFFISELSTIIETLDCNGNFANAEIVLDMRNKSNVSMIFLNSNRECKVKRISK